jgi:hypothetical protein
VYLVSDKPGLSRVEQLLEVEELDFLLLFGDGENLDWEELLNEEAPP